MEERKRLCGQAVIDFANAASTDEGCSKHFEKLARIMEFDDGFAEKVKGVFPFLAGLGIPSDLEAKSYGMLDEDENLHILFGIDGRSPKRDEPSDRQTIHDAVRRTFWIRDQLRAMWGHLTMDEEYENFLKLEALARHRRKVKSLHRKIEDIQVGLRNILDSLARGVCFHDIPGMPYYIESYRNFPQARVIVHGDFLSLAPVIDEHDYEIAEPIRWVNRLQDDLAYCLVTFLLNRRAKEYLHKCEECGQHFLARKVYFHERYFCSDKCRHTWNNRRKIQSGEAREYKKRARAEGKYQ